MRFEFGTAGRIIFGRGTLGEIGPIARDLGRHALVVTGRDPRRAEQLLGHLSRVGVATSLFAVASEPTTDDVVQAVAAARAGGAELVVGFGGGSALDTAKAVAALLTNDGDLFDYLEVIGRAKPLAHPSIPCIAIPTTGGTGSEVTRNAVLSSPTHRVKVSLRSPFMLPRVALVDPDLTVGLSPAVTASTGLDALTQLIEPFVSTRANPLTDAWCRDGIARAARALPRACKNGDDRDARSDMALASLFGGLALAHAGLGAVHGLAGPIGGMFPAPHGAVCAALLPHVMATNLAALQLRAPGTAASHRYDEVAQLLTGDPQAKAFAGVQWVERIIAELGIPGLAKYGISEADTTAIVAAAGQASSMKTNPMPLTSAELAEVLARSR